MTAIIDEADSVMIDEAATPLVLAGSRPHAVDPMAYQFAWQIAQRLDQGKDFQLLPQKQEFEWTPGGKALVEATARELAINQLQRPWTSYVEQALRAQHLFLRDVHYVVADDKILLVDQHTGRIVPDRSWQDGLHQAVQVKEGVTLTPETFSIARITRQRYFSLYDHLCGMTGTTQGNEKELQNVYGLTVRIIATHRPCQRKRLPLRVFGSVEAKDEAIAADVLDRQKIGQPVLVGTPTIEASLRLSETLDKHGISHTVLNGDQDADEAQLISQAGLRGAVMIATNMAGRGTDIALGPGVAELGGLHVIVSEPQDSARSTRQLMGRAARQGDPGSCQCFASADDGALLKYAPAIAAWCYEKAGAGELAEPSRVERELEKIQRRAEHHRARQREALFQQDQWLQQAKKDLG